jgi:hypothetical protein
LKKKVGSPIGGEFSLPFSPSKISLNLPVNTLPSHTVTSSGRDAFRAVIRNWANRSALILSAYTCDSVLNAVKLEECFSVTLIDISPDLYPDLGNLNSLTAARLSETILVVGNLFGIPYPNTFQNKIAELRGKGLVVIEDRTHNLFSPLLWLDVDGWFASGRKWIPSAGLGIYWPRPNGRPNILAYVSVTCLIIYRNILMRLLHCVIHINVLRNRIVGELRRTDRLLGLSRKVLFSIGSNRLRRKKHSLKNNDQKRCDKTTLIVNKIRNIYGVKILNDDLDPTSLPFNVTMTVAENRDELRAYLALKNIYLPVLWNMPESFREQYPNSWKLSSEVLSIPIDHRYGLDQLENVCNEISNFKSRT